MTTDARLDDDDAVELEAVLEQLARATRPARVKPWETAPGIRLELVDQLRTRAARQSRVTEDTAARTAPAPDPAEEAYPVTARVGAMAYDDQAATLANDLELVLARWVTDTMLTDDLEAPVGPRRALPASADPADLAAWLLHRLPALVDRPGSTRPELSHLRRLVRRGVKLVDRAPDRWYAGPCSTPLRDDDGNLVIARGEQAYCDADLYARPDSRLVVCTACGARHHVDERRAQLLAMARDRLDRPVVISRALTSLGMPCTPERIRQWATRGRLLHHGTDGAAKLYRLGDVMDLLEHAARAQHRTAARA